MRGKLINSLAFIPLVCHPEYLITIIMFTLIVVSVWVTWRLDNEGSLLLIEVPAEAFIPGLPGCQQPYVCTLGFRNACKFGSCSIGVNRWTRSGVHQVKDVGGSISQIMFVLSRLLG